MLDGVWVVTEPTTLKEGDGYELHLRRGEFVDVAEGTEVGLSDDGVGTLGHRVFVRVVRHRFGGRDCGFDEFVDVCERGSGTLLVGITASVPVKEFERASAAMTRAFEDHIENLSAKWRSDV